MNILIATDVYLYVQDSRIFAENKTFFVLRRYYEAFGRFSILSRIRTEKPEDEWFDITDYIIQTVTYSGFKELFSVSFGNTITSLVKDTDLVIGRLESFPACRAFDAARKEKKKYYAELMSDPWDGYWNYNLLGKIVAPYAYFKTKSVLKNSDYALYVTQHFLQSRYPCKNKSVGVSNVLLDRIEDAVLDIRLAKIRNTDFSCITLMTAAAVNVRYKGQQYVINAIPELNKKGIKVEYLVVGEGDNSYLKGLAEKAGVSDQVVFFGKVSLDKVFELLDKTDIYIQPSLQEGLPRAVIEAMSRACPCLGARTAGIPELLPDSCVFDRKSSKAIIDSIISNYKKNTLVDMAKKVFERSKEYDNDLLSDRRNSYYSYVKNDVEDWIKTR